MGNACLAGGGKPVQVGAPDRAGVGAEGQGLDDVGAAADAAVDDDFNPAGRRLDNFGQYVQGRSHVVQLPAAVVADLDGVDADPGCDDGVPGVDHTFENDGTVPPLP
ncbi:hypothetical protein SRABI26_03479 [Arthrobacter sp. Bi26]|nr:hypothetical protein SRABI26_03479 [Arthrobacter sp. Bi26]